jgi:hypothetical protein
VATMTSVAVLLLVAATPPISYRLPRILVTRPSRGAPANSQEQAYSPECMEVEFSVLLLYALIHPSAWNRNSRKYAPPSNTQATPKIVYIGDLPSSRRLLG